MLIDFKRARNIMRYFFILIMMFSLSSCLSLRQRQQKNKNLETFKLALEKRQVVRVRPFIYSGTLTKCQAYEFRIGKIGVRYDSIGQLIRGHLVKKEMTPALCRGLEDEQVTVKAKAVTGKVHSFEGEEYVRIKLLEADGRVRIFQYRLSDIASVEFTGQSY